MPAHVVLELDTTAPSVALGPPSGTAAGETLHVPYTTNEALDRAELRLPDGRHLVFGIGPDELTLVLPIDVDTGAAAVWVRDEVWNGQTVGTVDLIGVTPPAAPVYFGPIKTAPDVVDRHIDREQRLHKLEVGYPTDPLTVPAVRTHAEAVLEWLYFGAGVMPEPGMGAAAWRLWELEQQETSERTLRSIRGLRAWCGIMPNLTRRRKADGTWEPYAGTGLGLSRGSNVNADLASIAYPRTVGDFSVIHPVGWGPLGRQDGPHAPPAIGADPGPPVASRRGNDWYPETTEGSKWLHPGFKPFGAPWGLTWRFAAPDPDDADHGPADYSSWRWFPDPNDGPSYLDAPANILTIHLGDPFTGKVLAWGHVDEFGGQYNGYAAGPPQVFTRDTPGLYGVLAVDPVPWDVAGAFLEASGVLDVMASRLYPPTPHWNPQQGPMMDAREAFEVWPAAAFINGALGSWRGGWAPEGDWQKAPPRAAHGYAQYLLRLGWAHLRGRLWQPFDPVSWTDTGLDVPAGVRPPDRDARFPILFGGGPAPPNFGWLTVATADGNLVVFPDRDDRRWCSLDGASWQTA